MWSILKYSLSVFPAGWSVIHGKPFSCSLTSFNWDRTDGDWAHTRLFLKVSHVNGHTSVHMDSEMWLEIGPLSSKLQALLKKTNKQTKTKSTHLSTSTRLALINEELSVGRTWSAATSPVHSQRCSHYSTEEKSKVTQTAGWKRPLR